jgi:plastocyanin
MKIPKNAIRSWLIFVIIFLSMVGMSSSIASAAADSMTIVNMTIQDQFLPREISVEAGTTVQWLNLDDMAHTASADLSNDSPGGPDSDILFPNGVPIGQTFNWTVPTTAVPGTKWFYHCRFHGFPGNGQDLGAGMSGSITVAASSIPVGAAPGLVQLSVAANQVLELKINSTNSHGDTPLFQWFLFTEVIGGNPNPVYLLADTGVFNLNQALLNLPGFTYTFDNSGETSIAMLSMSDLGLSAGDVLIYGYAYMNQSGVFVLDNVVFITVI